MFSGNHWGHDRQSYGRRCVDGPFNGYSWALGGLLQNHLVSGWFLEISLSLPAMYEEYEENTLRRLRAINGLISRY